MSKENPEIILTDDIKIVWDGAYNWTMYEYRKPKETPMTKKKGTDTETPKWTNMNKFFSNPLKAAQWVVTHRVPTKLGDCTINDVLDAMNRENDRMVSELEARL